MTESSKQVTIVVPLYNERENVAELLSSIHAVMVQEGYDYEIIAVDDGSTDGTLDVLRSIQGEYPTLRIIEFRRNFGQTAAMTAGFDHARGEIIIPIDGDLQNDPADIPRLIATLEHEDYDVVSGWRHDRQDTLLTRKIPSWVANHLIGVITGLRLHDYGCTLKAYRRDVIEHLRLYGEMHRFIPAIASWSGAKVTELRVNHRARQRGKTKYGLSRTVKVMFDLMTLKFLGSFSTKPLHVFGMFGMLTLLGAAISGLVVIYQKWLSSIHLAMNRNPLLILTTLLLIMGVQFLLMGLLAEMLARTYHESQKKPTYIIRQLYDPAATGNDKQADSKTSET